MWHVAVIGSGPAGYYSAEALQKALGLGWQQSEPAVSTLARNP